jgi:hypothetical protein
MPWRIFASCQWCCQGDRSYIFFANQGSPTVHSFLGACFVVMNFLNKATIVTVNALVASLAVASVAEASSFTRNSPAGGAAPSAVTEVGGIVLDLVGANNTRVTTQLAASSLFTGYASTNPQTIGTQTGFSSAVTSALGGGISKAAIRFTLDDGDTASGDFDFNDVRLLLNGLDFGNWSAVEAENTNSLGSSTALGFSGGGFRNNVLDTGWFFSTDSTLLASFYNSLVSSEAVIYALTDVDPTDNFFDFKQGIDGGLINVGTGPVVQPGGIVPVPTPALLPGLIGIGAAAYRKRKGAAAAQA